MKKHSTGEQIKGKKPSRSNVNLYESMIPAIEKDIAKPYPKMKSINTLLQNEDFQVFKITLDGIEDYLHGVISTIIYNPALQYSILSNMMDVQWIIRISLKISL